MGKVKNILKGYASKFDIAEVTFFRGVFISIVRFLCEVNNMTVV